MLSLKAESELGLFMQRDANSENGVTSIAYMKWSTRSGGEISAACNV